MRKEFDYIEEANQTMSGNYHEGIPGKLVAAGLETIAREITSLDAAKKSMFYGRKHAGLDLACEIGRTSHPDDCEDVDFEKLLPGRSREDGIRLFHGIIGLITEAGELAKALSEAIWSGEPLDLTNVVEEVGDGFWYDAAILRVLGMTFEQVQQKNIDKLRARFPDRFTEFDANHRNLDLERKILEEPGLSKPLVVINNWEIISGNDVSGRSGGMLFGDVVGHPRLGDARGVKTSSPRLQKDVHLYKQGDRLETTNTMYVLGTKAAS